jgi:hypothetical protein
MITITIACIYAAGFLITARAVFQRIRPNRVPACGKTSNHNQRCYRRVLKDTSVIQIDKDSEAAGAAAVAGLFFPFTLIWMAIVLHPGETPSEKTVRLEKENEAMERKITQLERTAGIRS